MNNSDVLLASRFGKESRTTMSKNATTNVVVYTRVSTKEQADNNLSLDTQRRTIDEFSKRNGKNVLAYFGGTYESAKTDGRKEFQRMLDFIKKNKGKVSQILVYALDRFSRTGGSAIKIASDLREKHGVEVFSVTQPADTSNPSGAFTQDIQFIFSQFDNQLRRQRVIAGMTEKFKRGDWVVKPPQGYDIIKINGNRKIVVNEEGKKIKLAFEWKVQGLKNEEITDKLKAMGVKMYKQQLHKIFLNPFYCGIISHGMLHGKIVDGKHEAMVSKELFLKVNDIVSGSTRYGVPHKLENENVPLKVFTRCQRCGTPFTGYLVRNRGLYYYKCRKNGCGSNTRADILHERFGWKLAEYSLWQEAVNPLLKTLHYMYEKGIQGNQEREQTLKSRLTEVTKKIDTIEEKHYVTGEMNKEAFDRFRERYRVEGEAIMRELGNCGNGSSNKLSALRKALAMATQLPNIWGLVPIKVKELFQKLVFPEGITYEKTTEGVLTNKINSVFATITNVSKSCVGIKKGTPPFLWGKSLLAEREGFEPYCPSI
jgi:DNA invertase Pin-like site-specific DNA recombinase